MTTAAVYGAALLVTGLLLAGAVSALGRERIEERIGPPVVPPRPARRMARRLPREVRGRAAARALAGVAGAVAGHRLAGPVGALAGAVGGVALVRALAGRDAARREERLEGQVGDAVGVLAASARSGLSIRRALAEAVREAEEPLREVLESCLLRLEVGEPIEAALEPLAATGRDGRLLVTLLVVHGRTGGDLPTLLEDLAETIRRRRESRRQARALSAQGRASGAVLALLPVSFVGLLSGTGAGGLGAFYRTGAGSALLGAGLALEWVGFLWLRRLGQMGERS